MTILIYNTDIHYYRKNDTLISSKNGDYVQK